MQAGTSIELIHQGATMSVGKVRELILCLHAPSSQEIASPDWDAFCRISTGAEAKSGDFPVLVVAPCEAVPDAKQRQQFTNGVSGARIALLCNRRAQRVVINLLGMFVRSIHSFDLDDVAGALAFLNCDLDAAALALELGSAQRMMEALGGASDERRYEA